MEETSKIQIEGGSKLMNKIKEYTKETFEEIKHIEGNGEEY